MCYTHYGRWRAIGDPLWEEDLCDSCGRRRGFRDGNLQRCRFCPHVDREPCAFSECDEPVVTNGWCNGHSQQDRKHRLGGAPMRPLRAKRRKKHTLGVRDEQGRKECLTCGEWKPEPEFSRQRLVSDGLDPRCRVCVNRREVELKYAMPVGGYLALVQAQAGRCGICTKPAGVALVVDHDHSCCPVRTRRSCGQCVRELLCAACNCAIGMLRESPMLMTGAIAYIA